MVSERVIGRLSIYRRILEEMKDAGEQSVFSHQLASLAGCTPAQVRRDLMVLRTDGTPSRGYEVDALLDGLNDVLVGSQDHRVVLVGIGNLGRALLTYFQDRRGNLSIAAAFDSNPEVTGRVISGCRCYSMDKIADVIRTEGIRVAMLAVPAPQAQAVADELTSLGVRGILNFAPTALSVSRGIYVENMDMTMALEKVTFFAQPRYKIKQATDNK